MELCFFNRIYCYPLFSDTDKVLHEILANPHLRQIIVDLDKRALRRDVKPEGDKKCEEDLNKTLTKAMQKPLFVEFVDQCLAVLKDT